MELVIKRAAPGDLEMLMKWRMEVLREVFSVPADQPMDELDRENRRYYERMLQNGGHIACFACVDGEAAGCGGICIYEEMPSPDNPCGKCAYLMNIYTRPRFRRQGVGEAVVRWLAGQASQLGISKIYLESSEAGLGLYKRLGFVPMQNMMKLPDA